MYETTLFEVREVFVDLMVLAIGKLGVVDVHDLYVTVVQGERLFLRKTGLKVLVEADEPPVDRVFAHERTPPGSPATGLAYTVCEGTTELRFRVFLKGPERV